MPDQTAMMLTEEEWQDLADICRLYKVHAPLNTAYQRRIKLCNRIINATLT